MSSTQRRMGKRSLSLVSKLDPKQLTSSSYSEPEAPKPRDLLDLNTLEEAIPVVRAAVRFRTALDKNTFDKTVDDETEENEMSSEIHEQQLLAGKKRSNHHRQDEQIIRDSFGRKRSRKPHQLY